MLIVDAQVHLWGRGRASPRHRAKPFRIKEALDGMAEAGVAALVNHPPGTGPAALNYAIRAAKEHPTRFATVTGLKLDRPGAPARVRKWRDTPGMIGLRFLCLSEDERSWPVDGTMDWLWPLAEEFGIPVSLCGPVVLPLVEGLATRHPNLKLVIDHLGFVGFTADHRLIQSDDILKWARFPNVAVKLTGAPDYAPDEYPYPSMHDTIHALYDAYGPDRLFWGTDLTRLRCTWRLAVTMFTEELPWLPEKDKLLIMGAALCRWYGWRLPTADPGS
jgi:predicted TIM-barrel fold metal-dependent hydrolase